MPKIRFPTRIALATDEAESARYALKGTLVTPDGFAAATDGRIAACIKMKLDELAMPVMVPQRLGPGTKTDLKAEFEPDGHSCQKHGLVKGQKRTERATASPGRFPRVGDIFTSVQHENCLVVSIDVRNLRRLAQAINVPDTPSGDLVSLLVPIPSEGIVITKATSVLANSDSQDEAAGVGVIMPGDVDATQVLGTFRKLSQAAAAPLDAAAKAWSEQHEVQPIEVTDDGPKPPRSASSQRKRRRSKIVV